MNTVEAVLTAIVHQGLLLISKRGISSRITAKFPPRQRILASLLQSPILPLWTVPRIRTVEQPQITKYWVEEHKANKAGLHYDITVQAPDGRYYRWATRNPKWDQFGLRRWILQPEHFQPTNPEVISKGYGAGTCKVIEQGKALIWTENDHLHMVFSEHPKGTFVWLGDDKMVRANPRQIPVDAKEHYKQVTWEKANDLINDNNYLAFEKKDGARGNARLEINKDTTHFSIGSYRPDKRLAAKTRKTANIDWTNNLKDRTTLVEREFSNSRATALVDKYGKNGKLVVEMNCETWVRDFAQLNQKLQPNPVKGFTASAQPYFYMFDIKSVNGKPWRDYPYDKKLELIRDIHNTAPRSPLKVPPHASTPLGKRALVQIARREPGVDGIVFQNKATRELPTKAKFREPAEGRIVGFQQEKTVSGTPKESSIPIVRWNNKDLPMAGSLSSALKADMYNNPDEYIGETIQFDYTRTTHTGTPFQPIVRNGIKMD